MAYYRKNKRRFDPRYFMNERMEEDIDESLSDSEAQDDDYTTGGNEGSLEEMIPGDPGVSGRSPSGPDVDYENEKPFPDGASDLLPAIQKAARRISVRLVKRSSPCDAAGDEEEQLANLAYSEEEHEEKQRERHRIRNLPKTYGEEASLEE